MKLNDKTKLQQLLKNAIIDLKYQDADLAQKLAISDQKIRKGCNAQIECSKISTLISMYLMTHHYHAPKSLIQLQAFVSKIAQDYWGKISPIMWFQ